MFGRTKTSPLSAINSRLSAIADRENETAGLIARFESESRAARDATIAASRAKEERDQYRRVLAAAIASDRRNELRIAELDVERKAAEALTRDEVRSAGAAVAERDALAGRITSLEALIKTQVEQHEQAMADSRDRAWAEREAARAELVKLGMGVTERSDRLAGEVREALTSVVGAQRTAEETARAIRAVEITSIRRRLLVGLGLGAAVLGIAVTPHAVLSAFDAEQAVFVHLASGLSPWHLIAFALMAFALAALLLTLAKRDAERRPSPA